MFTRFVHLRINPDHIDTVKTTYTTEIIPALRKIPGCLFAGLIQSSPKEEEFISMTLWDSKDKADHYEEDGSYKKLLAKLLPFMAESAEWKVQLSKDLILEYAPVPEEPVLKQLNVTAQADEEIDNAPTKQMHVRIVGAKIADGKMNELRTIYKNEIIPELIKIKGCRYAYLAENQQDTHEALSVTIWDTPEDAEHYEQSGRYAELLGKVKHTMSDLYKWKMALEQKPGRHVSTQDDLSVTHYDMVTGKVLKH